MADLTFNIVSTLTKIAVGSNAANRLTGLGSKAVAQIEPPYFELSRTARLFCGGNQAVSTAVIPVVDLPSTLAPIYLHNSAQDGGRCLVPIEVSVTIGSGTIGAAGFSLFAGVTASKTASPPTANTAAS